MTGLSLPWKMTQEEKDRVYPYYKKLISMFLIVGGSALMLEHLFMYEGFDLLDFIGHEYFGLGMIIAAFLLSMKWGQWKEMDLHIIKNWFR